MHGDCSAPDCGTGGARSASDGGRGQGVKRRCRRCCSTGGGPHSRDADHVSQDLAWPSSMSWRSPAPVVSVVAWLTTARLGSGDSQRALPARVATRQLAHGMHGGRHCSSAMESVAACCAAVLGASQCAGRQTLGPARVTRVVLPSRNQTWAQPGYPCMRHVSTGGNGRDRAQLRTRRRSAGQ